MHIVLTIAVTTFVAFRTLDIWSTLLAAVAYGYVPGAIASLIVAGLLDLIMGKRFGRYLENRRLSSPWYQRYQYLRAYIPEFEEAEKRRLAEEKRVRLQPVRNEVQRIREEVEKVNDIIRTAENVLFRKRKWYPEYRKCEKDIEGCIPRLKELEQEGILVRAKFGSVAEETSYEFYRLYNKISDCDQKCRSLLQKMQGMKDWTPPVRTTTPRPATPSPVSHTQFRDRVPENREATASPTIQGVDRLPARPTVVVPQVVVPPPPPQRRVLNRQLAAVPIEEYVGAAKARMDIGDLGEIVALHYELRRVEAETRTTANGRVTRVSKEIGNLGYDIESISQGKKVFIEVKSTTGDFWKDFFLSANELKVMRRLGEDYWLYRIFELSREDGSAKLSIFRGRKEIDTSFEFEPTGYKFVGRTTQGGDGRLFEI